MAPISVAITLMRSIADHLRSGLHDSSFQLAEFHLVELTGASFALTLALEQAIFGRLRLASLFLDKKRSSLLAE